MYYYSLACRRVILTLSREITDDFLRNFGAVLVTNDTPLATQIKWNKVTHASNIVYLLAVTNGVTATFFSDFGDAHEITDSNGEPPISNPVENIEVVEEENGSHHLVITVTRTKHDLGIFFFLFLFFLNIFQIFAFFFLRERNKVWNAL